MSATAPNASNQKMLMLDKKVYIEQIEEFRTLHFGLQDRLIQEFRSLYDLYFDLSEEHLARILNHPKLLSMIVTLARDRKTHKLISIDMITVYHFVLLENDNRPENQYITGHGILVVDENYRMNGLIEVMSEVSEDLIFKLYPKANKIAYGFIVSPYTYNYVMKRSSLTIPGENIDPKVQKLFEKMAETVPIPSKRIGDDPFVMSVFPPVKTDFDFLHQNIDKLPMHMKYYAKKTGLIPGVGILTVQVNYMLEGNTAGLPAGDYIKERKKYKGEIRYIQGKPTFDKPIPKI
ncbi:hypothetical protein SteCoe_29634 [Stentor coeruleus]|uniref:Uncharacterized protein n=1 Tax=Stentor coeruleus TaxID=5963 RepID=A0A1R2B5F4_9CILI|nr:hypothetical protein SteCoe_29634 [Stentor coeruleus]